MDATTTGEAIACNRARPPLGSRGLIALVFWLRDPVT
jgi:hypothetical protein